MKDCNVQTLDFDQTWNTVSSFGNYSLAILRLRDTMSATLYKKADVAIARIEPAA